MKRENKKNSKMYLQSILIGKCFFYRRRISVRSLVSNGEKMKILENEKTLSSVERIKFLSSRGQRERERGKLRRDTHPPEISPRRFITRITWRSMSFEGTEAGSFRDDSRAPNTFNLKQRENYHPQIFNHSP